ncbi:MAG: response regulator, partial [Hyphomicrobiaceae bacterium]|nr:response regulator [Hyphomicrobiaceae bacterium]
MVNRILIVDDDPAQRRILEETIKRLGFDARTASSGEEALQLLEGSERTPVAVVLLDLIMSGLDGMAVLERLKERPGSPPVIV